MDEWRAFVDSKREFVALALGFKKQMFGARAEAKESHMVKQQVEQIVESKEEPYVAK